MFYPEWAQDGRIMGAIWAHYRDFKAVCLRQSASILRSDRFVCGIAVYRGRVDWNATPPSMPTDWLEFSLIESACLIHDSWPCFVGVRGGLPFVRLV